MEDLPLAGITVVDFTRVLAGPYCTRLLADLGARVIKIERPGEGDEIRYTTVQLEPGRSDQSSYYVRLNVGKWGIALDLGNAAAREIALDLVRAADVVVENFSPGVMKRYGLDEPRLREVKPDLVYCAISGFGQSGPLSGMQAYAHLVNAMSGIMDLERGGEAPPRAAYLQAADVLAGAHAFGAICAALLRRARFGKGAFVDVSMLECLIAADDITFGAALNGASVERRPRAGMLVHGLGDRYVAMQTAGAPHLWIRLTQLMQRPDLVDDPRFATPMDRRRNWDVLAAMLREWLDTLGDVETAVRVLAQGRVPCAPMLTVEQVVTHPHLKEREAFPDVAHPVRGSVRVTATPFHLDGAPVHPGRACPAQSGRAHRRGAARSARLLAGSHRRASARQGHRAGREVETAVPHP